MSATEVMEEQHPVMLVPQLTGKARQACKAVMVNSLEVKNSLLLWYGINTIAFWQRFQHAKQQTEKNTTWTSKMTQWPCQQVVIRMDYCWCRDGSSGTIVCFSWVEPSKNANNAAVLHAINTGLALINWAQKCTIYTHMYIKFSVMEVGKDTCS